MAALERAALPAGIYPGLNRRERRKVEALDWAEQEYSIDEGDLRLRFRGLIWLMRG